MALPKLSSIHVFIYCSGPEQSIIECVESVLANTSNTCSVLFLADGVSKKMANLLIRLCKPNKKHRTGGSIGIIHNGTPIGLTQSLNKGFATTSKEYICIVDSSTRVTPGWLDRLYTCMLSESSLGAVGPLTNSGMRQNVCQNINTERYNPSAVADLIQKTSRKLYPRMTSIDSCPLFNRAALLQVGKSLIGPNPIVDLCHRIRRAGFGIAISDDAFVSCADLGGPFIRDDAEFFNLDPLGSIRQAFEKNSNSLILTPFSDIQVPKLSQISQASNVTQVSELSQISQACQSVKVYSPSDGKENEIWWGDYWVKQNLLEEFGRQGWPRFQTGERAGLSIHLMGLQDIISDATTKVAWIYSHPEENVNSLEPYKLIYTLSQKHAERLQSIRSDTRILLPATSQKYKKSIIQKKYDVLFVGNSLKPERVKIIKQLIATGKYNIGVVGAFWERHIDNKYIIASYWDNNKYSDLFNQAAMTVYIHSKEMQEWDFVAVRVLDVIACSDCFVICDKNEGLKNLGLGDIPQFNDTQHLEELIDHYLARPHERLERLERWREVIQKHHTFANRIKQIKEDLSNLKTPTVERRKRVKISISQLKVRDFLEDQQVFQSSVRPQEPKFSVIMPTYSRGDSQQLSRAINSVLVQTFKDFEFIIVDDGSTDSTRTVVEEFLSKDGRIIYLRHDKRCGLPGLRVNEGVRFSRGKYIAYQFDDDWWEKNFLEEMHKVLNRHVVPTMAYCVGKANISYNKGGESRKLGDLDFNYGLLHNGNYIANNSVVHHKEALDLCGMYDPHVIARRWCDYDLWLRMAKVCEIDRCPQCLVNVCAGLKDSVGNLVPLNYILYRRYIEIDRVKALLPDNIENYVVGGLEHIKLHFTEEQLQEICQEVINPFFQEVLNADAYRVGTKIGTPPKVIYVSKADYSTSTDVIIKNYCDMLQAGNPYADKYGCKDMAFSVERDLHTMLSMESEKSKKIHRSNTTFSCSFGNGVLDYLALHRTIAPQSGRALDWAHERGKSVLYFIDDNMLTFYQLDDKFKYISPESSGYKAMLDQISRADVVVGYSPEIIRCIEKHNPRVISLHTSIAARFIQSATHELRHRPKYVMLSGPAREKELIKLWPTLINFISTHDVELHIWGMNPINCGGLIIPHNLANRITYKDFDHNYERYLQAIQKEKFDFLICPLFGDKSATISKSPIKFLEATAAGAIGIYSNVEPYAIVKHGRTGLKANEDEWEQILEESTKMSYEDRNVMFNNAKAVILQEYTIESQVPIWTSTFEAADLHRKLQSALCVGGKAKIAYFFHEPYLGGATLHLLKHALMMRECKFDVVLCTPERIYKPDKEITEEATLMGLAQKYGLSVVELPYTRTPEYVKWTEDLIEDSYQIEKWLTNQKIKLVHGVLYLPSVFRAAHNCKIPVVCTLHHHYGTQQVAKEESYVDIIHSSSFCCGDKWKRTLKRPVCVFPAPIEKKYFDTFHTKILKRDKPFCIMVSGTLQPRKRQMEAVKAVEILIKDGYHIQLHLIGFDVFRPEYVKEIKQYIKTHGLEEIVIIKGFVDDTSTFHPDCLLCTSDEESMPQTILKAMASGTIVVSTPVDGVPEVIVDGITGFLTNGYDIENIAHTLKRCIDSKIKEKITQTAHEVAYDLCREDVIRLALIRVYNKAVDHRMGLSEEGQ